MPHVGSAAQPIVDVTGQQQVQAGPAIPIEYVTSGPVMGGAAQPIVVVTDGRPRAEMQALPVYAVSGSAVKGGQALPVYVIGANTSASSTLLNGLLAYWPLQETSGSRADSVGANTLTVVSSDPPLESQLGHSGARSSSGAPYILRHASNSVFQFAGDRTIAFWTYDITNDSDYPSILGKYSAGHREWLFVLGRGEGDFWFNVSPNGSTQVSQALGHSLTTGTWHLVIGKYDATAHTITLKVDNVLAGTTAVGAPVNVDTSPFSLGEPDAGSGFYWNGLVRDLGIWGRITTDAEDTELWRRGGGVTYPFTTPNFTLLFHHDFSSALDTSIWTPTSSLNANGAGGANLAELEAYVSSAVTVSGGKLVLTANDVTGSPVNGKNYTSGIVQTKGKFNLLYGKVEILAKVPSGQGFWPALWMLPQNDIALNYLPEIDLMESKNLGTPLFLNYYYNNGGFQAYERQYTTNQGDGSYHTYCIEWTPFDIRWFYDDVERWRYQGAIVANVPMYILMNFAVGGGHGNPDGTTVFPAQFLIDDVKVYSLS